MADFVAGSTIPLDLTVTDTTGKEIDLTGATVGTLTWRQPTGAVSHLTVTVTDATHGGCQAQLTPTVAPAGGTYNAWLPVTLAGGAEPITFRGTLVADPPPPT